MAFPASSAGQNGYRLVSGRQPRMALAIFSTSLYYRRRVSARQPCNRTLAPGGAPNPVYPWPYENFESYTVGDNLNGLNADWNWAGPWVVIDDLRAIEDFESYTVGASLNTLNGGTGWAGAWVII